MLNVQPARAPDLQMAHINAPEQRAAREGCPSPCDSSPQMPPPAASPETGPAVDAEKAALQDEVQRLHRVLIRVVKEDKRHEHKVKAEGIELGRAEVHAMPGIRGLLHENQKLRAENTKLREDVERLREEQESLQKKLEETERICYQIVARQEAQWREEFEKSRGSSESPPRRAPLLSVAPGRPSGQKARRSWHGGWGVRLSALLALKGELAQSKRQEPFFRKSFGSSASSPTAAGVREDFLEEVVRHASQQLETERQKLQQNAVRAENKEVSQQFGREGPPTPTVPPPSRSVKPKGGEITPPVGMQVGPPAFGCGQVTDAATPCQSDGILSEAGVTNASAPKHGRCKEFATPPMQVLKLPDEQPASRGASGLTSPAGLMDMTLEAETTIPGEVLYTPEEVEAVSSRRPRTLGLEEINALGTPSAVSSNSALGAAEDGSALWGCPPLELPDHCLDHEQGTEKRPRRAPRRGQSARPSLRLQPPEDSCDSDLGEGLSLRVQERRNEDTRCGPSEAMALSPSVESSKSGARLFSHRRCRTHPGIQQTGNDDDDTAKYIGDLQTTPSDRSPSRLGRAQSRSLGASRSPFAGGARNRTLSFHHRAMNGADVLQTLTPQSSTLRRQPTLAAHSLPSPEMPAVPEAPSLAPATPVQVRQSIFEAFFLISAGPEGRAEATMVWPSSARGGKLEEAVVGKSFCPSPQAFARPHPAGCEGEPFVFSLLETTLDPKGDPSAVLYGCVCGKDLQLSADPSAPDKKETSNGGKRMGMSNILGGLRSYTSGERKPSKTAAGQVLCLVSKVPVLSLLFQVLSIVRRCLDKEDIAKAQDLLQQIFDAGLSNKEKLQRDVMHLDGLRKEVEKLEDLVRIPKPQCCLESGPCLWQGLADDLLLSPSGQQCHSRWQALLQANWALTCLLQRFPELVDETLVRLLACVLLEQKVLLIGDTARTSTMALALRALISPFRWLHPFIPAAPPEDSELLGVPFADAPVPILLSVRELPAVWGYGNIFVLPSDVVAAELRDSKVKDSKVIIRVSNEHETVGGLRGEKVNLPSARERRLVQQLRESVKKQKKDPEMAVSAVLKCIEREVIFLKKVIEGYVNNELMCFADALQQEEASHNRLKAQHDLAEQWRYKVSIVARFMSWLKDGAQGADAALQMELRETLQGKDRVQGEAFLKSFFQTQLCQDLLHETMTNYFSYLSAVG